MRNNEEQLRHMEKLEREGKLSESSKEALKRLRQRVQDQGGELRQPTKSEPIGHDEVEHTKGYASLRKSELYATPFQKIKRKITEAFVEPAPLYEQRKQREYEEKQAYGRAYHEARLRAVQAEARKKAVHKSHVGGFGSNFIAASLNEIGGMTTGAANFTFGGGAAPRERYARKVKKGRSRRGHGGDFSYMPDHDLSDFVM